ncbi:Succinate--CoA ligase [ADP-forming] subunit alpha [Pandoraea terrae]|uniref:Succinate--CoA ligase [ADP-forming] subunit alpha n=1 Tax=Pandoraea terrae TaxID=1537710 RepID=A0A5E4T587_9BURK|nr:acyl-CoA synthetase FdrA [Pandoraea terrae]VVD81624.1 Succinate--CoA ligase [ADP-forming] subunit alpha [Pandoraea terrae]
MPIQSQVKKNLYKDSVALMLICQQVIARTGVKRTTLLMGTRGNKDILAQANLLQAEVEAALPSDIMIIVEDDAQDVIEAALREVDVLIEGEDVPKGSQAEAVRPPRSLAMGVSRGDAVNIAQISVPGAYAGAEAIKALRLGLSVFLFSDNVPIEQERAIKQLAAKKGLLVMGPDCGTAILNGVPLGFANVVRRGRIGIVAASGTGLQEVATQIHRLGEGISHAIGTGGRDVYEEIGASTMRQGLDLLAKDAATDVIVIVSKPPAQRVTERIMALASDIRKPVVVLFLGSDAGGHAANGGVYPVGTLEAAAGVAVALARGMSGADVAAGISVETAPPAVDTAKFGATQRYLRALYSGGTFCAETQVIWREAGIRTFSNTALDEDNALADPLQSREHSAIDLGDDVFTVGRPHPMIDSTLRVERLLQEARDPSVAVVVLDVVLGYGSHEDPAGALAPAIVEARRLARQEGRELAIVSFVCGTEDDPQRLSVQRAKLQDAGAMLVTGSTAAARLAAAIAIRLDSARQTRGN